MAGTWEPLEPGSRSLAWTSPAGAIYTVFAVRPFAQRHTAPLTWVANLVGVGEIGRFDSIEDAQDAAEAHAAGKE
jgi:hypothetical protein